MLWRFDRSLDMRGPVGNDKSAGIGKSAFQKQGTDQASITSPNTLSLF